MPLNKFASWGRVPPRRAAAKGLATAVDVQLGRIAARPSIAPGLDRLHDGLQAIASELSQLGRRPPDPTGTPSAAAFTAVAALGQLRDALCDQRHAKLESVNTQIRKAAASQSLRDAEPLLAAHGLAAALQAQLAPLQADQAFEPQRRRRLAQLVALEAEVLARVGDGAAPVTS